MAICGFRADNYPVGLLEGEDLHRILALLEKLKHGCSAEDIAGKDSALLEVFLKHCDEYYFDKDPGLKTDLNWWPIILGYAYRIQW